MMPRIASSSKVYGLAQPAEVKDIPIAEPRSTAAALFGQTCFEPGQAKKHHGTAASC